MEEGDCEEAVTVERRYCGKGNCGGQGLWRAGIVERVRAVEGGTFTREFEGRNVEGMRLWRVGMVKRCRKKVGTVKWVGILENDDC